MSADRLNDRQRRFVNAYATNGLNATAAARDAGYSGGDAQLGQVGSRLLKVVKVAAALEGLIGKAIRKAERGAIADLAESLEHTTSAMRRGGADATMAGQHLGLSAAQTLIKHYEVLDAPAPAPTVNILAVLGQLDIGTLREIKAAFVKALPPGGDVS